MRKKAVIFDMDGVLIDSEENYNRSNEAFLSNMGIEPSKERLTELTGSNALVNARRLLSWNPGIDMPEVELERVYAQSIRDALYGSEPVLIGGLDNWLPTLRSEGIMLAVASSSTPDLISFVLKTLGIEAYMDTVTSGKDVLLGKPEPDIFLKASERLSVPPEDCLVIEDSPNGILSAKRAKMTCFAFSGTNRLGFDQSLADEIIAEYSDETLQRIISWSRA